MPIYKTGKVKNGKQQYRVFVNTTDSNGKKRRVTKCVYGLGDAKETEMLLTRSVQEADLPSKITVQKLYDEYIKVKEYEVRASSLNKTKSILENHVLNTDLNNTRIDRLSAAKLQEWKNSVAEKNIMISTKNNAYRELRALLNYAVRMEYIPSNPLKNVGKFKDAYFTVKQDKLHYYTVDQFKLYRAAAEKHRSTVLDCGCYLFFNIAYFTGMRKGEINALHWSDIDGDIIHVQRSVWQKNKGDYEETPPKNKASDRRLQMPSKLKTMIEEHKELLKQNGLYGENKWVCGGAKPISDTTLENRNAQYAQEAGLPHIRIHDFRHSHATLLINDGINIMEISRRLGHSDVKMTWNTYGHLYPAAEEKAVQSLDKAF